MALFLVIDDDPDIRRLLAKLIEIEGHSVIQAEDAKEADAALEQRPDGIFIDVAMPGETGAEFLLRLRQHPTLAETPAMFITAHANRIMPIQNAGLAGTHVVDKPFRRKDISEAVKALLRKRRRRLDSRVRLLNETVKGTVDDGESLVARNLSIGSVFLLGERRRPIGEEVWLRLRYKAVRLGAGARVSHSGRDGVGFAFIDPSPEFLASVLAIIDDLLTEGGGVDDRRRATRKQVSAAVIFTAGETRADAKLRDLSATGAFIVTADPPPQGTETYVYLPGYTYSNGTRERTEIRGCRSKVVRHTGSGFGCRFEDPSAEFKMAIDEMMQSDGKFTIRGL